MNETLRVIVLNGALLMGLICLIMLFIVLCSIAWLYIISWWEDLKIWWHFRNFK